MCESRRPLNGADSIASLRERLIDVEGESGACSDNECGCHRGARELREEIEDMEAVPS